MSLVWLLKHHNVRFVGTPILTRVRDSREAMLHPGSRQRVLRTMPGPRVRPTAWLSPNVVTFVKFLYEHRRAKRHGKAAPELTWCWLVDKVLPLSPTPLGQQRLEQPWEGL